MSVAHLLVKAFNFYPKTNTRDVENYDLDVWCNVTSRTHRLSASNGEMRSYDIECENKTHAESRYPYPRHRLTAKYFHILPELQTLHIVLSVKRPLKFSYALKYIHLS